MTEVTEAQRQFIVARERRDRAQLDVIAAETALASAKRALLIAEGRFAEARAEVTRPSG